MITFARIEGCRCDECNRVPLTFVNVCHDGFVPTTVKPMRTELPLLSECCSPLVRDVIQPDEAETLAGGFKALADPTRLRLISLVAAHEDAEACVCELTDPVGLAQPTVSHHLKILVDAGILSREQRGKWAYYRLVPGTLDALAALITSPAV
jgi:ArsR family transcriptional regulator